MCANLFMAARYVLFHLSYLFVGCSLVFKWNLLFVSLWSFVCTISIIFGFQQQNAVNISFNFSFVYHSIESSPTFRLCIRWTSIPAFHPQINEFIWNLWDFFEHMNAQKYKLLLFSIHHTHAAAYDRNKDLYLLKKRWSNREKTN